MKTSLRLLLGIYLLFVAQMYRGNAIAAEPPKKLAYLVGVSEYDKAGLRNLKYAEADVSDLGTELKKQGFQVEMLLGSGQGAQRATTKNLRTVLFESSLEKLKALDRHDVVLFGFAGHGVQRMTPKNGKQVEDAYFCPVDCVINAPDTTTLMSISDLMDLVASHSGSENNLFVIDACRDNPSRGGRGIDGSKVTSLPSNMACLFGASSGTQSFESDKLKHGLLTYYVLDALKGEAQDKDGEVNWDALVGHVKKQVARNSKALVEENQIPNSISNLKGESPILARLDVKIKVPSTEDLRTIPVAVTKVKAGEVITNTIGMKLAHIHSGEFIMGSPETELGYNGLHTPEEILHPVRITKPFYLGVHCVTQEQYEQLMGRNPSKYSAKGEKKDAVQGIDTRRFPVDSVTWNDAVAFCEKLSKKEGKNYRLPTEAEWEYACRAGTQTPFWFGSTLNGDKANCDGREPYGTTKPGPDLKRPAPVGEYPANPFGLYDMHGNTYQWCQDWYSEDYYKNSPVNDPTGPEKGTERVSRGGSMGIAPRYCRSAFRHKDPVDYPSSGNSIRVALDP